MLHAIIIFILFIAFIKTDFAELLFAASLIILGGYPWVS